MIRDETCDIGGKPDTEHCIECGQEITEGECYCPDCVEAHRLYIFEEET